jgi:type IV secretion system protein TrbG
MRSLIALLAGAAIVWSWPGSAARQLAASDASPIGTPDSGLTASDTAAPTAAVTVPAIGVGPADATPAPPSSSPTGGDRGSTRSAAPRRRQPSPAKVAPDRSPGGTAVTLSNAFAANPKALPTPGPDGTVVFPFGESVPTIICAPLRICDVALEPGETINDRPQIGDSVRWKISPAVSGDKVKTTHIVIKPTESDLETDLLVPTNKRTYHLHLLASDHDFVYAVAFSYPDGDDESFAKLAAAAKPVEPVVDDLSLVATEHLDFAYDISVEVGSGRFKPEQVFSDGHKTFIHMPDDLVDADAPALVVIGPDGNDQIVNYRLRNHYYVIDKLVEQAALISGLDDQEERVVITHRACAKRDLLGFCETPPHLTSK